MVEGGNTIESSWGVDSIGGSIVMIDTPPRRVGGDDDDALARPRTRSAVGDELGAAPGLSVTWLATATVRTEPRLRHGKTLWHNVSATSHACVQGPFKGPQADSDTHTHTNHTIQAYTCT